MSDTAIINTMVKDINTFADPLLKYSWFPNSSSLYLLHLHEIIYSFIFYQTCSSIVAPRINRLVFGDSYTKIKDIKLKVDFDVHTVSMIQSFVSAYIMWPALFIPMTKYNIVTHRDEYCSMVTALCTGYFIWDFIMCTKYYSVYGMEYILHAMIALYGSLVPLYPLCQIWIPKFLTYELSTPFVNINWYMIQLAADAKKNNRKSNIPMWFNVFNGICLMTIFFCVRIVWGHTAEFVYFKEMWHYRHEMNNVSSKLAAMLAFVTLLLNTLNLFWFSKMIKIAIKLSNGKSESNNTKDKRD